MYRVYCKYTAKSTVLKVLFWIVCSAHCALCFFHALCSLLMLSAQHSLLFFVLYALSSMFCVLFSNAYCSALFALCKKSVLNPLCLVLCALCSMLYALSSVLCALFSMLSSQHYLLCACAQRSVLNAFVWFFVLCALCSMLHALCSLLYAFCSAFFALCSKFQAQLSLLVFCALCSMLCAPFFMLSAQHSLKCSQRFCFILCAQCSTIYPYSLPSSQCSMLSLGFLALSSVFCNECSSLRSRLCAQHSELNTNATCKKAKNIMN